MPLEEIQSILKKFRKAGFAVFSAWGGEPTIRNDLPEILASAKKLGYRTSMCTNCFLLPQKADSILPHLDVLLCSLDGYGESHDEFRGLKGLFDRVVKSIEIATASYPKCHIKMWTSIHKKNIHQVEQLAHLAQKLKVGIEFFPISLIQGYNDELVPDNTDRHKVFSDIIKLKQQGLPIRNPYRALKIMQHAQPFQCNFGQIALFLDHKGNVYTCEDSAGNPRHFWSGHKDFVPEKIFTSDEFKKATASLKKCNICSLPCMLELSGSLLRCFAEMSFNPKRWR